MKKYIGIEEVQAKPMTYGEAFTEGIIPYSSYEEEFCESKGYLIEGDNKDKGWLPKEVFGTPWSSGP